MILRLETIAPCKAQAKPAHPSGCACQSKSHKLGILLPYAVAKMPKAVARNPTYQRPACVRPRGCLQTE